MNRWSGLERFNHLTDEIKEVVLMFNFGLNVQAWEQENERDRDNDSKRLLHIAKIIEEHMERLVEEQLKGFGELKRANEIMIGEQQRIYRKFT